MQGLWKLKELLRSLGLAQWAETLHFHWVRLKNWQKNSKFTAGQPDVLLPPDRILYETFLLDYRQYFWGGLKSAQDLFDLVQDYLPDGPVKFLDWGCGPARITRHMPDLLNEGSRVTGTDLNPRTIQWCKSNIPNISFYHNTLNPPLAFDSAEFNLVFGISVISHMSEHLVRVWLEEILRIGNTGAVYLLTTQGNAFMYKLQIHEKRTFASGLPVIREISDEGSRLYSAFHPPKYVKSLIRGKVELLSHIPGERQSWGTEQDFWIVKKHSR